MSLLILELPVAPGATRVSLYRAPPSGLSRQHRNLWNELKQDNSSVQMRRGRRGVNDRFPPLPDLSFPSQKLSCEQTQHIGWERLQQEAVRPQLGEGTGRHVAQCSDALS